MKLSTLLAAAVSLAPLEGVEGMYTKSSPVLQVTAKTYDTLIAQSNYTSIIEFFAPWCGHCKNLKPAYEKAAKNLEGLAQVAAVDCDEESNKAFCGRMGIQGFPTLKIVKPSRKPGGRPVVEDYSGERTATGIVEAVAGKINNHVIKVTDADLDTFLAVEGPRALLFTDKGAASTLLKGLAIEFLGVLPIGIARSKETKTVERFGIASFPKLVLLPEVGSEPVVYDGIMKKPNMVEFLSQAATPNSRSSSAKTRSKQKTTPSEPLADDKEEAAAGKPDHHQAAPVIVDIPPIPTLHAEDKLARECLGASSHMCVLAFLPSGQSGQSHKALETLAKSAHRHAQGQHRFFPFYAVPHENPLAGSTLKKLELDGEVEIIAVNSRRGWWRRYEGDFGVTSVDAWIDAIRMGDGVKSRLPDGLVVEAAGQDQEPVVKEDEKQEPVKEDEKQEPVKEDEKQEPVVEDVHEDAPEDRTEDTHDEL